MSRALAASTASASASLALRRATSPFQARLLGGLHCLAASGEFVQGGAALAETKSIRIKRFTSSTYTVGITCEVDENLGKALLSPRRGLGVKRSQPGGGGGRHTSSVTEASRLALALPLLDDRLSGPHPNSNQRKEKSDRSPASV